MIQSQDYYPYMSAGPPSALEHVWKRDLIFSPESRDDEGRRVVVLRLGQWPPSERRNPILSVIFSRPCLHQFLEYAICGVDLMFTS